MAPYIPTFIAKYRPYKLDEFFENDKVLSVIRTLQEIEDMNILFVGFPSSGKTTLLNSIIREYYGLSQHGSVPEANVMFINNLKEQGINFFRTEMKTFCQTHCSLFGKKKMVIIDDLDTINEQSQQVFRNYMDKYKHNVHFIAVCTSIQKVIESIQSRIHIIKLPLPSETHIRKLMMRVVKEENIKITPDACECLLKVSEGSIRKMINNLEKMWILGDEVDVDMCRKICSNISSQYFDKYIEYVRTQDIRSAVKSLYDIHDYGYSVIDILDYFFTYVKSTEILSEEHKYKIIPLLCKYITIFNNLHENVIELALFTDEMVSTIGT